MRAILFLLVWTASALISSFTAAQSQEAGTAIVVLDGSGSMGGPLEGQKDVKFDLASRALLQLLPSASPQSRTGLVTFGNRRKGDCTDADVAVAPASANLDQFTSVFGRIGPTGKGPLVHGVREAAKVLPPGAPATLIVIHDDMDNCRQDVCAAASDLAKITPKVTVHVITISLDKSTSMKMSCLATATGGRVFEARDAASVESSLAEAMRLAGVTGSNAQAAAEPLATSPPPVAEPTGPPSVRLSAGLSADGAALAVPVQWTILTAAAADGPPVKEALVPILTTELPPGSYIAQAQHGLASGRQNFEVAGHGQTQARVSLEAANIKISSVAGKASDALSSPILTVSAIGDKSARTKPVYIGQEQTTDLVVPAGAYRIAVRDGLASKQQDITLAAGDVTPVDFALGTGHLELSSQNREGGELLDGTAFILSVDDPDAPQGRREITRTIAPQPGFVLPAGTYYVTAKLGAAEVRERIAIGTGDIVKRSIPLNGAWTSLTVNLDPNLSAAGLPIAYRVITRGKEEREIARINAQTSNHTAEIFLPQGSYRFVAAAGRLNVSGVADADIVAGPKAAINISAAVSELTIAPDPASTTGWDLRDRQGNVVQRSAASRTLKTLLVAPGHYLVRIEQGDSHVEKPVDLKPGERLTVPLGIR